MRELSNTQIDKLIAEWIHDKRNREILHDRLIDNMRFDALAEKYNLSVQHTKNIVRKGKETVFKHTEDI